MHIYVYIYRSSSILCGRSLFKQFIKSLAKVSKLNFTCGPKLLSITHDNLSLCIQLVILCNVSCAVYIVQI